MKKYELNVFFKSILDCDEAPIVVCDLEHIVVYINPAAAINYRKYEGFAVGKSIFDCHNERSCDMIKKVVKWFGESNENNKVHTFFNEKLQKDVYMVALRDENGSLSAIMKNMKYE